MNSENRGAGMATADRTPSVFRRCLALALGAALALVAVGCQPWQNFPNGGLPFGVVTPPPPNPGAENYSTNELHEGDVVSITFEGSTNFDTVQKIALDGRLNLDMVGPVKASGLTLTELEQVLTNAYKTVDAGDVISAKLLSSESQVYVSGAVLRPGPVEMDRPLMVIEAVMTAGGWDPSRAKLSDVTVLRVKNGRQETYHINLKRVLEGKEKTPFYLQPFDIIYVPTKTFNY
ncbi:MAG: polysaccharide biosynthesis/export family protein [Limisphaerales bacterium]